MNRSTGEPMSAALIATREFASEPFVSSLERAGFRASQVRYRPGTLDSIARARPHVAILVIRPNDEDERRIISRIAEVTGVPIVVLAPGLRQTGFVEALREGADACVSEADGPDWLAAQVEATVRRTWRVTGAGRPGTDVLEAGDLVISFKRCEVQVLGRPLHLTPMEFRIVAALAENSGTVMSPSQILASVNEAPYTVQQARDAVKVYVRSIRQKLAAICPGTEYIVNVRGFGYILEPHGRRGEHEWADVPGEAIDNAGQFIAQFSRNVTGYRTSASGS